MKRTLFSHPLFSLVLLGPGLLLTGCSSVPAPVKKAAPKKPAEPVSGQSAIFQMFQVARTWAPDAQLLKVENGNIAEVPPQPGKYGLWRAVFISESRHVKRNWQFAAADSEGGVIKGVRPGDESPYASSRLVRHFAIQEVKSDTTTAFEAAMAEVEKDKDMKKVLAENKDLPVQFLLEWPAANAKPTWRVIFGASVSTSKFSIFVDAGTGKFVKKVR